MSIYTWECKCGECTEVERKTDDYQIPPDNGCIKCASKDLTRIIVLKENGVKGFILLGDRHWHDKEYTRNRSIK